jgi:hypothetical protein
MGNALRRMAEKGRGSERAIRLPLPEASARESELIW